MQRDFWHGECFGEIFLQFGFWAARDLDGGELPHAREQGVVVRAGILDEKRAALRVEQNQCGDRYRDGRASAARSWNFVGDALRVGLARLHERADQAVRGFWRADHFAQFHERLVPVPGRFAGEQVAGGCG